MHGESRMNDLEKIVWGALGGIAVYAIGQIVSKLFIEPLYEIRKAVGEVRFNLGFYAATIHTPIARSKESSDKAQEALMKNSCELIAKLQGIPLFEVTRLLSFGVLPRRKAIEDAAVQLRGLSTYVHEAGPKAMDSLEVISKRVAKIEKLLGLKPLE